LLFSNFNGKGTYYESIFTWVDTVASTAIKKFLVKNMKMIPAMVPEILPTGRYVELPLIVVMKFKGNKIAMNISIGIKLLYYQIGLIDNKELPIIGIEQSKKLQELALSTQMKAKKKTMETIANSKA
jgi:hypothetical protein